MEQFQDGQPADIPAGLIDADFNYRRRYNEGKMASLRADIRERGIIQRVIVRPRDNGRFQLVVGNRRYRAFVAEFGQEAAVKSEVRLLSDAEATAMMAAENGEREDPSIIEDAELAARMLGVVKGDRDEAARRLGWDRKKFDRRVALMNATQQVRDAYLEDKIGVGHVELLAALRKEVQDRVISVFREKDQWPTLDQLKAMAEQSLQSLESAIFDRAECNGCQYNTGFQQAMFDTSFEGSRCTNKECFSKKTEAELGVREAKLKDTYQVVRIVRPGDNSTVIALRAEGKRPVGAEQAAACRTCANFGACVSGVPDSLGKVYEEVCFDQACNDEKPQGGRTRVRSNEALPGAQAAAADQPGKERSGAGEPARLPRLRAGKQRGQAEGGQAQRAAVQAEGQNPDARRPRAERAGRHRETEPAAARLDQLLPVRGGQGAVAGTGRVDQTQAAGPHLAPMQALLHPGQAVDETRIGRGARVALGNQRARRLVERRGKPHEPGVPEVILRPHGAGVAGGYPPAFPESVMNRRMRNRTYGGVGGRRG